MARTLPIKLRTLAAAVVVIASGLIIFYAYQSIINSTDEVGATLPIIKADADPFRVLPDNPGGAEIPNQGSELFKVLSAENNDGLALDGIKINNEPETIIDEVSEGQSTGFVLPEIPEARTESLYSLIDDLKIDNNGNNSANLNVIPTDEKEELKEKLRTAIEQVEQMDVVQPEDNSDVNIEQEQVIVVPSVKPNVPVPVTQTKTEAEIKVKTTSKDTEVIKPKPTPALIEQLAENASKPAESTPRRTYHYIQLASVPNEADARSLYAKIRDDFPSLVRGLSVSFPKADLGARGVFTRIQVGPLDSQAEAKKRCADYTASARGGTCLVVSR